MSASDALWSVSAAIPGLLGLAYSFGRHRERKLHAPDTTRRSHA
ncbi:hypothetical protein ACWFRB_09360 [Rhodococcus sp. NPDC055112]